MCALPEICLNNVIKEAKQTRGQKPLQVLNKENNGGGNIKCNATYINNLKRKQLTKYRNNRNTLPLNNYVPKHTKYFNLSII